MENIHSRLVLLNLLIEKKMYNHHLKVNHIIEANSPFSKLFLSLSIFFI